MENRVLAFFFPAKVNFVSVTKIIPNVESLVTEGDELITAALWTRFLHESIASSCVSLPALWRSGSGSFWKLPGRNQPSLNEANSDKSQRNIFIEVSGEIICSFLFLERAWDVVLCKYYGGWQLWKMIWQCGKKGIFWEKEQRTGWVCKLTAAFGAKEDFFCWQGGPCSQRENWLGQSALAWQGLKQCYVGSDKKVLLEKKVPQRARKCYKFFLNIIIKEWLILVGLIWGKPQHLAWQFCLNYDENN